MGQTAVPGPLVSVGIPTYNRPDGLAHTLEQILGQDYPNLEVIVSDNASTDPRVEETARSFAAADPRVIYVKQPKNLGVWPNFRFLAERARGKYFMWAADDDEWAPDFISYLVAKLESEPQVLVAMTDSQYMLSYGSRLPHVPEGRQFAAPLGTAFRRMANMVGATHIYNNILYGLFRRDTLFDASRRFILDGVRFTTYAIPMRLATKGEVIVYDQVKFFPATWIEGYIRLSRWLHIEPPEDLRRMAMSTATGTNQAEIALKSLKFIFPKLYVQVVGNASAPAWKRAVFNALRGLLLFFFRHPRLMTPFSISYHAGLALIDCVRLIHEAPVPGVHRIALYALTLGTFFSVAVRGLFFRPL